MSEFRRRLMMQKAGGYEALPDGCVRCEYLESTGTQYVDTLVKPSYSYSLTIRYCHIKYDKIVGEAVLPVFGARTFAVSTGNGLFWAGANAVSDDLYLRFGGDNVKIPRFQPYEFIELKVTQEAILLNGAETGATMYKGMVDSGIPSIYIFGMNQTVVTMNIWASAIRVYGMTIEEDGVELHRFIPILDHNGTPCLYDAIVKQFHYNQGTGQFLYKIL